MPPTPPILELADPDVIPDLDTLITEDGKPVDNIFIEHQYRLLTESLYTSWAGPGNGRPFRVMSNVGLFFTAKVPPLVPDVMLSLDVAPPKDVRAKESRSYFVWIIGKLPEVVIEIVSDRRGGELTSKKAEYARLGVHYYVVYDPDEHLEGGVLQAFKLVAGEYLPVAADNFGTVGLGLRLWEGIYEGVDETWLRWCDTEGLIPTGNEKATDFELTAKAERQKAERESRRADEEMARANEEKLRADQLAARLRSLGHEVDGQ